LVVRRWWLLLSHAEPRYSSLASTIFWYDNVGLSVVGKKKTPGYCGDCWAFASTEVLETQTCIEAGFGTAPVVRLSPQELADCLTASCDTGGRAEMGWELAEKKGIELLSNYPITSTNSGQLGSCRETSVSTGRVTSYQVFENDCS
jgi:hypothetical protein